MRKITAVIAIAIGATVVEAGKSVKWCRDFCMTEISLPIDPVMFNACVERCFEGQFQNY